MHRRSTHLPRLMVRLLAGGLGCGWACFMAISGGGNTTRAHLLKLLEPHRFHPVLHAAAFSWGLHPQHLPIGLLGLPGTQAQGPELLARQPREAACSAQRNHQHPGATDGARRDSEVSILKGACFKRRLRSSRPLCRSRCTVGALTPSALAVRR